MKIRATAETSNPLAFFARRFNAPEDFFTKMTGYDSAPIPNTLAHLEYLDAIEELPDGRIKNEIESTTLSALWMVAEVCNRQHQKETLLRDLPNYFFVGIHTIKISWLNAEERFWPETVPRGYERLPAGARFFHPLD